MTATRSRAGVDGRGRCRRLRVASTAILIAGGPGVALGATTRTWIDGNGDWTLGSNWSSPIGAGAPADGDTVNITQTDGVARTITYNYTGPAATLPLLVVDLTGAPGAAAGGPGATLTMPANNLTAATEYIGYSGAGANGVGTFNQSGGVNTITPTGNGFYLAVNATDRGTYNLSGGALVASNAESVGYAGVGVFNQSGGTHTINPGINFLYIGLFANSGGTYNLSGGSMNISAPVYVGYSGTGTFNQTGGTHTVAAGGALFVGYNTGTGFYNLGAPGLLTVAGGAESIGYGSTGTFTQTGGTHAISNGNAFYIGYNAGVTGNYELSGGSLTASGNEYVGNSGTGIFNQSGGQHTIANGNTLYIGYSNIGPGTGFYTLAGGSLTVTGDEKIGYQGKALFNQTGGTHIVNGNLAVGSDVGGNGILNLTGGTITAASMDVARLGTGVVTISNAGQLAVMGTLVNWGVTGPNVTLADGGTLSTGYISSPPSQFKWTGGTLNWTGSVELPVDSSFSFAPLGSPVNLTGSQALSVPNANLSIGLSSSGILTLGGPETVTVGTPGGAANLLLGYLNGSGNGVVSVAHSAAKLIVNHNAYIGGSDTASVGAGTFSVSAGSATVVGQLKLWNAGNLNLTGGTLNVGSLNSAAHPAGVNWTGGTLNFLLPVTVDSTLIPGASITLGPGKTLASTAAMTNNDTLLLAGGGLNATALVNNKIITGVGAVSLGGVSTNNATFSNGGTFQAGGPLTNSGTLFLFGQQTWSVGASLTNTGGTATLAGTQSWALGTNLSATGGSVNLQSNPGSDTAYTLTLAVTPSVGGAALVTIAGSASDVVQLRSLALNPPGAGGSGLLVIDAALGGHPSPITGFGAAGGSVRVYLGDGNGSFGLAPRGQIEAIWKSITTDGYWAKQNAKVASITRGITLASGVVTNPIVNGLSLVPSVDDSGHAVTYLGEDIQGDTNGDAKVDINDPGAVLQHLNTTPGSQAGESGFTIYTPGEGDVNGDLVVNINDLGVVLGNLNQTYAPAAGVAGGVSDVPEPTGGMVISMAAAMLARRGRRTQRRR